MPILAVFYATAVVFATPVSALWKDAIILLLALAPGAAYVSVINDLTDRKEDLAAGKRNRLADRSRALAGSLIAVSVAGGLVFCVLWRRDIALLSTYLAAWFSFTLYSVPPFRLKARGFFGVLADACGSNLFPTLVAILVASRAIGRPLPLQWMLTVAVWCMSNGVRSILWHQLSDRAADRAVSVRTFAERHPRRRVARIGKFIVFPIELAALIAMLAQLPTMLPFVALGIYALLMTVRIVGWNLNAVIVSPQPRFFIVLHEYYHTLLPLTLLVASALRFPYDWIVLAVHLVVFPSGPAETVMEFSRVWRERQYSAR